MEMSIRAKVIGMSFFIALHLIFLDIAHAERKLCQEISAIEGGGTGVTEIVWSNILSWLTNPFNKDGSKEEGNDLPEYVVSITSDNSIVPTCNGSEVKDSMFYPIGIVMKVLGEISLPKDGRLLEHYYVLTEYGMKYFVPKTHVIAIQHNMVYFFKDGAGSTLLCRKHNSNSCDIYDPPKGGPVLHADFGFAARLNNTERLRAKIDYFRYKRREEPMESILSKYTKDENDKELERLGEIMRTKSCRGDPTSCSDETALCNEFEVGYYEKDGKLTYPDAGMTLCRYNKENGYAIFPLKIVTREYVENYFEFVPNGSFFQAASILSRLLTRYNHVTSDLNWIVYKECPDEKKLSESITLGGSIGGKFESIISLDGKLKREITKDSTLTLPKGSFIQYSAYSVSPFKGVGDSESTWKEKRETSWLFDIKNTADCREESIPIEAKEVRIYHNKVEGMSILLHASEDIREKYVSLIGDTAIGYTPVNDPNLLRLGLFWVVVGSDQYYLWRDALRLLVDDRPNVKYMYHNIDFAQHGIVNNYFAHLIMASSFYFTDKKGSNDATE